MVSLQRLPCDVACPTGSSLNVTQLCNQKQRLGTASSRTGVRANEMFMQVFTRLILSLFLACL